MSKLDLYNDALALLGLRRLATLTDDTPPRYQLDGAYNRQGIEYCLQLVRPTFACKTVRLVGAVSTVTYPWRHTLPADLIDTVGYWSDQSLEQPVTRYIEDGGDLYTSYQYVWTRYISSDAVDDYDNFSPAFARVVGAYLALECATRLSPEDYAKLQGKFEERVKSASQIDGVGAWASTDSENGAATSPITTLSDAWVNIYNDALLIMGLEVIASGADDSNRRVKLDRTLSAGLVADLLEDIGWQFGQTTAKIYFDPSAEPAFGHPYAIPKPIDLHTIYGVWVDEMHSTPLKDYDDEGQYIFCDNDYVFMTYVSQTFLTNPSNWPVHFKRLVAARMAKDAAASLVSDVTASLKSNEMLDRVEETYRQRKSSATSADAVNSPPRRIANGSWTRARWNGRHSGRP